MMVTLRDGDARAVDLLLDRAASASGDGGMQFAGQADVSTEQLAAAEHMLKLLHVMPAADPAPDLLRRTMERIDSDAGNDLHRERPLLIDMGRPVA